MFFLNDYMQLFRYQGTQLIRLRLRGQKHGIRNFYAYVEDMLLEVRAFMVDVIYLFEWDCGYFLQLHRFHSLQIDSQNLDPTNTLCGDLYAKRPTRKMWTSRTNSLNRTRQV